MPRRSPHSAQTPPDYGRSAVQGPARPHARVRRTTGRAPEERYRPGVRRTRAEPLRAAWSPEVDVPPPPPEDDDEEDDGKEPSKASKLVAKYGWRAYALPVLMVLSVLVVFDSAKGSGETTSPDGEGATSQTGSGQGDDGPVATERPAAPAQVNIPTAELPAGGDFTPAGAGTWRVVPGQGEKVGTGGRTYTYTIEVEDGIDDASYTGDDSFASTVEGVLSNPKSWTGGGDVSLQRVGANEPDPDFTVSLTSPETAHRPDICGFQIPYEASCYDRADKRVVINLARWVRGAKAYAADMTGYRQYAINHEVGHALNNSHKGCDANDALAPVMMQQTFGVANDYVAQLNQVDAANSGAVPADGKVCKVNAWPNP